MSAFDPIIGYTKVKKDLEQIADTLMHSEAYSKIGVTPPKGLLLYGRPGVGKSLMADCLIKASGRKAFTCRKDEPSGVFLDKIKNAFAEAAEAAPSIVYLDDMDKFSNEDDRRTDTEEYVTIQSCIDESKGKDIFVLATANNSRKLPRSLLRAGRFDRRIEIKPPFGKDAEAIIRHYLDKREYVDNVDAKTVARIMDGRSCAALETLINEAGIRAGYLRKDAIEMDDLVQAALTTVFGVDELDDDCDEYGAGFSDELMRQIACHEAGHAVIAEILDPGCTTLVSIQPENGYPSGFTSRRRNFMLDPMRSREVDVLISLGAAAAVECCYGYHGSGVSQDFDEAYRMVERLVEEHGHCGLGLLQPHAEPSPTLQSRVENAVSVEIERYYRDAKALILGNKEFHQRLVDALVEKKVLLANDIAEIRQAA